MDVRVRAFLNSVGEFFRRNKKAIICYSVLFIFGLVIGIVAAVNYAGGEFENYHPDEIVYGAVKVFLFSSLIIAAGYGIIIVSATVRSLTFLSLIPFGVLGIEFGRYITLLVGYYAFIGIINLIFIYIPFFLITFVCMLFAAAKTAGQYYCQCTPNGGLRPPVVTNIKCYFVNVAINFFIFIVIGAMTKVIVVGL